MRVLRVAAAAACLAAIVPCASAQQPTTGTLTGIVRDQDGSPIPGASITVTGPAGARVVQSDAAGAYSLRFLPPGSYVIEAAKDGYATLRVGDVVIAAGVQTRQPLALLPGKEEEVTLKVSAPLVDPKKIELTSVFKTNQVIAGKPTGSDFTDVVMFAPGVVSGLGTGDGNWSIGGSSGFENSYIVDGVNATDSGYGGVNMYRVDYGALGAGVTTDILDEVQVKSAGFDAEYGQALGGIITGVIRTGTNTFSGSARASLTEFSAGEEIYLVNGAINTEWPASRDASLALSAGGPLVKDRLFAFGALNPVRTTRQETIARVRNPILSLDPGASETYPDPLLWSAAHTSGRETTRTRYNYAAKLTWNVTSSQRLEFVAFGDPSEGNGWNALWWSPLELQGLADTDGDGTGDTEVTKRTAGFAEDGGYTDIEYGATQLSLAYDGVLGSDWFLEAQVNYRRNSFTDFAVVDDWVYADYRPLREWYYGQTVPFADGIPSGGSGWIGPTEDRTWDLVFKASKVLGGHDIKFGGQYFDMEYLSGNHLTGPTHEFSFPRADGGSVSLRSASGAVVKIYGGIPGCDACVVSRGAPQYRAFAVFSEDRPATGYEWALFVQDTWSIGDHWVLKLGVRTTAQTLRGAGDYTLNFALDPEDPRYFTDTPTYYPAHEYSFRPEYSPRLGVSFDPGGNGKAKIYASAARYFERVPADLAVRQFSQSTYLNQMRFSDPQLTTRAPGPIYTSGLNQSYVMDGTRLPYMDEATLGWQQLLRPDLALEVRGIYRTQGRVLEDVNYTPAESVLNFYYWIDWNGDEVPDDDRTELPFPGYAPKPFGPYALGNFGGGTTEEFGQPQRDYAALEFLLNKRLSNNWQLTANYRYARLRGNYEGLYRNDNGQADPNITSLFDFPDTPLVHGQYQAGALNTDRPHVLNIFGSYFFNHGFELAGAFQWASGVPRTPLLAHPVYGNGGELPGTDPRYLFYDFDAGLYRLAGPGEPGWVLGDYDAVTRGELGRTPDLITLDLHVGWAIPIRDTRLKLAVDVANVTNRQAADRYSDTLEKITCIGNPNYGQALSYQQPRTTTLWVEWAW